ncbi:50S ribosomal protein L18 [Desulfonatronovibrio hydrogenovorans]|uniref:50S ribosomal protein L18 n=1 Tax=Desulfonatronovibrio hydrogenovorans TaxID=53245 RepID=UPI0005505B69|nr:50S ribosomal protein L18 [Desulfonatronovibrio hydrogenovorans]
MKISKRQSRLKRKYRIRKKINGTESRPRLVVFRSNKHIYAQIVNDEKAVTLASFSSLNIDGGSRLNLETAKTVGKMIGEKAKSQNIETVVFDRNGYFYHGRIKALAEGAREMGLKF